MAGYAFARIKNIFHKIVFNAILLSMLIPAIINTVPLYTIMRQINGINTYWAMILLMTTANLPFAIFLYTSFIKSMSCEIEEAAYIDGCSKFNTFWQITFPLLKPVTAAVIILNAVAVWNNYNFAVFFLQDQSMQTVPLAISTFFQTYGANWNLMAAAALMGLLPPVAVFLSFQKYFIKGIGSGAIKG
jgi:raffinose/stachyose/melibiose transport system permease protein